MKPKISIIIANYNNADYLTDCLRSVADQSFSDFECIVVDDGSSDGSAKIIRRYLRADKRFRAIFQKNAGASSARNAGLDIALGDWIGFLDSDDCFIPDALKLLYNLAEQNNADIVGGAGVLVADDFKLVNATTDNFTNPPFKIYSNSVSDIKLLATLGDYYRFVWVWRRLFRRTVLDNVRFDENLYPGEDTCFIFEAFAHARRIVESSGAVVYHRMAKTAVSQAPFNQKSFSYIVPTMRRLRWVMDTYYPVQFHSWFYRQYMNLVMEETICKAMISKRLMHQVAAHLRPIYGTRFLPVKYLSWRKRLIFWGFMKVFK